MTPHFTHLRAAIVETPQQRADRLLAEDRERRASDGWIEWKGGECPVDDYAIVDVRLLRGEYQNLVAGAISLSRWLHTGMPNGNIIAYRVVQS